MQTVKKVVSHKHLMKACDLLVPLALISLEIILNLIAVVTIINSVGLLAIVLLPVAIIGLVFSWPLLIFIYCLLKFFGVRQFTKKYFSGVIAWLLFKHKGEYRKKAWNCLYTMVSFSLPNNIVAQNCGYALVTATGESLQAQIKTRLSERETENLF
jgi:hypothetical protein